MTREIAMSEQRHTSIETCHIPEVARESVYSGVHARFFQDGSPSFVVMADTRADLETVLESIGKKFEPSSDITRHDILVLSPHSKMGKAVEALSGIPDPAEFVRLVRAAVEAGAIDEIYLSLIRAALSKSGGAK